MRDIRLQDIDRVICYSSADHSMSQEIQNEKDKKVNTDPPETS